MEFKIWRTLWETVIPGIKPAFEALAWSLRAANFLGGFSIGIALRCAVTIMKCETYCTHSTFHSKPWAEMTLNRYVSPQPTKPSSRHPKDSRKGQRASTAATLQTAVTLVTLHGTRKSIRPQN